MSQQERERRRVTDASDRAKNHTGGFTSNSINLPKGAQLFEPQAGTMYLDIIPYEVKKGKEQADGNPYAEAGDVHYERTFFVHKGIGAEGGTYICPKKTAGQRCPVCEYRAKLAKTEGQDEDVIKDMGPKERQLFNVFDRKNPEKGIQLWDISFHLFGKLLDERINSEQATKEWKRFHSPTEGMTLVVTFREKKYGAATFYETTAIDFKERKRQHEESIVGDAFDLDSVLKILSYDKLRAVLLEAEDAESPAADEDKPRRHKGDEDDNDPPVKKKPAPVEADEDDSWDEEKPTKPKKQEVEDEDDPPVKKKPKPAEDDDEKPSRTKADESWDEDDPPVKKKPAPVEDDNDPPAKKKPAADESWDEDDSSKKPAKSKKKSEDDEWS